jgi:putative transposase
MPNYIRWKQEGATYFFTVVTYLRRPILINERARSLLRRAMADVRQRLPFDMPISVLMPDHLHCIWTLPKNDNDFSERWRRIKERFTREWLAGGGRDSSISPQSREQGRRGVWQPRFWEHRIRDEDDYLHHRDYIHLNPVKHGQARNPGDWPWSSFHRHVREGWLDPNWPGSSAVELPEIPE